MCMRGPRKSKATMRLYVKADIFCSQLDYSMFLLLKDKVIQQDAFQPENNESIMQAHDDVATGNLEAEELAEGYPNSPTGLQLFRRFVFGDDHSPSEEDAVVKESETSYAHQEITNKISFLSRNLINLGGNVNQALRRAFIAHKDLPFLDDSRHIENDLVAIRQQRKSLKTPGFTPTSESKLTSQSNSIRLGTSKGYGLCIVVLFRDPRPLTSHSLTSIIIHCLRTTPIVATSRDPSRCARLWPH